MDGKVTWAWHLFYFNTVSTFQMRLSPEQFFFGSTKPRYEDLTLELFMQGYTALLADERLVIIKEHGRCLIGALWSIRDQAMPDVRTTRPQLPPPDYSSGIWSRNNTPFPRLTEIEQKGRLSLLQTVFREAPRQSWPELREFHRVLVGFCLAFIPRRLFMFRRRNFAPRS